MKWCAVDSRGCIVLSGRCDNEATAADFLYIEHEILLDIPEEVTDQTHYYLNEEFLLFGECPKDHQWDWSTYSWVLRPDILEYVRRAKQNELRSKCQEAITSGFSSAVLGTPHFYSASSTEQDNLTAAVNTSLLAPSPDWLAWLWCQSSTGEWALIGHAKNQVQQLNQDCVDHIAVLRQRHAQFLTQLNACTSVEQVSAINWF